MTQRQNEIINAAIQLIAKSGIQGMTIKNLANAIKVTEPAIYRHFESKTAILAAILENFKNFALSISSEMLSKNESALERIFMIYRAYFNKFSESPSLVSVIFSDEIFKNDKNLSSKISSLLNTNEEMFCSIVKNGQKANEIRNDIDNKQIALIIMGSMRLLVKKWEISSYSFDLKREGKKLFTTIKTIIKK
jgi:AcrR family transcriptional regulator